MMLEMERVNKKESNNQESAGRSIEVKLSQQPEKSKKTHQKSAPWIYEEQETRNKLAILEDPQVLTTALRHVVRILHEDGEQVTTDSGCG